MLAPDKALGTVPDGDKYFLGRAKLENGVQWSSAGHGDGKSGDGKKGFGCGGLFSSSMEFIPEGFLQMVYLDADGFDRSTTSSTTCAANSWAKCAAWCST